MCSPLNYVLRCTGSSDGTPGGLGEKGECGEVSGPRQAVACRQREGGVPASPSLRACVITHAHMHACAPPTAPPWSPPPGSSPGPGGGRSRQTGRQRRWRPPRRPTLHGTHSMASAQHADLTWGPHAQPMPVTGCWRGTASTQLPCLPTACPGGPLSSHTRVGGGAAAAAAAPPLRWSGGIKTPGASCLCRVGCQTGKKLQSPCISTLHPQKGATLNPALDRA